MPKFQLTLIFWNVLLVFIIFIVVLYQIARGMGELVKVGTDAGYPMDHPYFQFLNELSSNFYIHITIAFFLGTIVSGLVILYLSHKMAGPLYRMRLYFTKMAEDGEVKDISFRKGDYLTEFSDIINTALKKIK